MTDKTEIEVEDKIDTSKRDAVKKLAIGAIFAAPLMSTSAHATFGNHNANSYGGGNGGSGGNSDVNSFFQALIDFLRNLFGGGRRGGRGRR